MPTAGGRSSKLAELAQRIGREKRLPDLNVEEGETRILTHESVSMRPLYTAVEVESAADLKELIGIPDLAAPSTPTIGLATIERSSLERLRRTGALSPEDLPELQPTTLARTINPQVLHADRDGPERDEALSVAHAAAEAFIFGNSRAVRLHEGLIDTYLKVRGATIFVPIFNDITVADKATLTVSSNTFAVFANRIRLFGTGRIVCNGPTTFDCLSFQGNVSSGGSFTPPGGLTGPQPHVDPL
jgi:hypothetical protein